MARRCVRRWLLLAPLRCADRRSHRAELLRLAARVLERRPGVGVDEVALLDVGVAACDQLSRVLSLQESSGNSAGPEVDAVARVLGNLGVDHDIGDLEPPSGSQHAVDLIEHEVLVRH